MFQIRLETAGIQHASQGGLSKLVYKYRLLNINDKNKMTFVLGKRSVSDSTRFPILGLENSTRCAKKNSLQAVIPNGKTIK